MKNLAAVTVLGLSIGLYGGFAHAVTFGPPKVNNLSEPGSLLVFPLIDNQPEIDGEGGGNCGTIVDITNLSRKDVWLSCKLISHPAEDPNSFDQDSFNIFLTGGQPVWWNTAKGIQGSHGGERVSIPPFADRKGFLVCFAIDNPKNQLEVTHNALKGDGILCIPGKPCPITKPRCRQKYSATPHQRLVKGKGDRILNLDGEEYTAATNQITFEGFRANDPGNEQRGLPPIGDGELVVANLDIDFRNSTQPDFDIDFFCTDENEAKFTRHSHMKTSRQFDLAEDLKLDFNHWSTPKFQCTVVGGGSTSFSRRFPLWGLFLQAVDDSLVGENVWQRPQTGAATKIILEDPVPPRIRPRP